MAHASMPAAETVSVADSVPTGGVALGVRGGIEQLCSRFTKFPKVKTCPVVFCVFDSRSSNGPLKLAFKRFPIQSTTLVTHQQMANVISSTEILFSLSVSSTIHLFISSLTRWQQRPSG